MRPRTILAGGLLALIIACGRAPQSEAPAPSIVADEQAGTTSAASEADNAVLQKPAEDTTAATLLSSAAARVDPADTLHRFIRRADLRFRVKDVVQATLGIEDIVGAHRGWVEHTDLRNTPMGTERIAVSADSTLEVSRYDLVNTVTLRVPDTELDGTLRAIGQWVDLFDHRTVEAEDVRLRLLANAMDIRRQVTHGERLADAIDARGRKLKETTAAEVALLQSAERADAARLADLDLEDRIHYSTVKLDIHQRTLVNRELVANDRDITAYEPSLISRMGTALGRGWDLLEGFFLLLLGIWPVVVVALAAGLLLRKRMRTAKA